MKESSKLAQRFVEGYGLAWLFLRTIERGDVRGGSRGMHCRMRVCLPIPFSAGLPAVDDEIQSD